MENVILMGVTGVGVSVSVTPHARTEPARSSGRRRNQKTQVYRCLFLKHVEPVMILENASSTGATGVAVQGSGEQLAPQKRAEKPTKLDQLSLQQ